MLGEERQYLTMRMNIRRFTRLTNAFSKKLENHARSVALHFLNYNYIGPHATLHGATLAMEAGVVTSPWEIEDLVKMIKEAAPPPNRPSNYKRREISQ